MFKIILRTLEELYRIDDREEVRHDLKYSPDGLILAVASNDNFVSEKKIIFVLYMHDFNVVQHFANHYLLNIRKIPEIVHVVAGGFI